MDIASEFFLKHQRYIGFDDEIQNLKLLRLCQTLNAQKTG